MSTGSLAVLMAVHNGEKHLNAAVNSILAQTYADFEFVIVDDASTDASSAILAEYARRDKRIRIITNPDNLGLTASLNIGLSEISAEYVARMDADDISLPERLAKQLEFMESAPEMGACGCWLRFIDRDGAVSGEYRLPTDSAEIRHKTLTHSPMLSHPAMMLRTEAIRRIGGYSPIFKVAQDYDLLLRLLEFCELGNLPEILLEYRLHEGAISSKKAWEQTITHVVAMQASELRRAGEACPLAQAHEIDYPLLLKLAEHTGRTSRLIFVELLLQRNVPEKERRLFDAWAMLLNDVVVEFAAIGYWRATCSNYPAVAERLRELCVSDLPVLNMRAFDLALEFERLKCEHENLKVERENLLGAHESLKVEHESLKGEYERGKYEAECVSANYENLRNVHEQLVAPHNQLVEAHNQLGETHEQLVEAHEQLTICCEQLNCEMNEIKNSRSYKAALKVKSIKNIFSR